MRTKPEENIRLCTKLNVRNKLGNYCNAFDELINASCLFSVQRKVTSFTQSENINVAHSPLEEICNEGKDSLWSKGES